MEMNEEAKKMMALAGLKEGNKKFLTNESFSEETTSEETTSEETTSEEAIKDADFIIIKFDQLDVEPNDEDEKLYKLK